MKWYIGQPIVAIKNSRCGKIKKGSDFIVNSLKICNCKCCHVLIDVGLKGNNLEVWCMKCNVKQTDQTTTEWKQEILFAPIDVDISELTEILTKENQLTNE